ncbi:hypothetical protein [Marichromatium bheemlicum]|uniref:Uncharacterized protein n=1 Tax=Marichromatium bheemlicum TaxID=365339 RepID=A0ABX1IBC2_9GAMM|nr:hypothetical protein [Marichromatium bheemlicum]NKN34349.1 hypothetical protein [Marichromatium bheemlicum]
MRTPSRDTFLDPREQPHALVPEHQPQLQTWDELTQAQQHTNDREPPFARQIEAAVLRGLR